MWDVGHIQSCLTAVAQADPGHEIFGASRHRHRLGPVLDEAEVAGFEALHGVSLPEAYRAFLTDVGDGGAGPHYGLFRLDGFEMRDLERQERETPGFMAAPFPHTRNWNPYDRMDEDEYFAPRQVAGSLIVAEFGCGAFHRLVVTGEARGEVWLDDRASDGGLLREGDFREWYTSWLDARMRDVWKPIDDDIIAERLISAIAVMRERFGDTIHEAIDRLAERHERLRETRPGDFTKSRQEYGRGFYS
ncbi:SMI1/KNR4 family protein [Streptosporangium carneum]|uniref:Knr4/Smi1-like domain-containing protein n=1 Tax=Streptosporangium carneum TaxID=47481 RepID=A0A9W6IAD9_9ACTN|nr:SMI1/KNR4 family protein [Streptosporangium carneum]GLK15045.1 hypothetical protein GCM10017600_84580 [Streptosporangium carneum]